MLGGLPSFASRREVELGDHQVRMLLWIVNGLGGGSPTRINSSRSEAALRIYVGRILKRASGNVDCLRDIMKHTSCVPRWAAASEVQEGGPVATSHAEAAILLAHRRLLKRCGELIARQRT